jgi:hypothetical protein
VSDFVVGSGRGDSSQRFGHITRVSLPIYGLIRGGSLVTPDHAREITPPPIVLRHRSETGLVPWLASLLGAKLWVALVDRAGAQPPTHHNGPLGAALS